jgi:hypothetical protein
MAGFTNQGIQEGISNLRIIYMTIPMIVRKLFNDHRGAGALFGIESVFQDANDYLDLWIDGPSSANRAEGVRWEYF